MDFHRGKAILARQMALFMVFLVLTIPFFSASAASVSALSITKITVVGSAGVEDVMSADNDYFTATVKTSEEVDTDQLFISYTKEEAFDECTGTMCTYTSSQTDRAGQELEYTIQLIEESVVVDKVTGTLLVDEEEPEIEEYEIEREGDDITITYDVVDTACSACDGCSGIDYLLLFQDDEEIEKINIASQCSVEDTLETTISELNLEDGTHELCLQAVDNVGYETDFECEVITVDLTGPHFETGSIVMTDAGSGLEIVYIGTEPMLVDVSANVSDDSLNENTVRADLSALNSFIGSSYENVTATQCEQSDDDETLYTCTWESYYVEGVSGGLSLKFWASDNEGNEGKYSPTYTLTQDTEAPSVISVYTETSAEKIAFKAGKNSLYADLDPTGSAFVQENLALTVSAANLDDEKPTECWDATGYWTCVWNFTVSSSISGRVTTALLDATDDAGNDMEQYEFDVTIDTDEPEITSITTSLSCPTATDTLEVVINATDATSEDLFVYFYGEDIRTDNEPIVEECEEYEAEQFTCLVFVDDLVSYPTDEDVTVKVKDLAGNTVDDEVDIEVCELEEAGTPDFVTLSVEDPSPIDSFTLSYIDLPVYVSTSFSMPSRTAIVGKSASCDGAESVYFLDESTTSSLMVVVLPQQEVSNTTTELSLDCTLSMTMQYGDKVYANPEVEEFDLDIPVYETPLGEYGLSLADKIESQKQLIAEKQGKIDKWVKLNRYVGWLCKIVDVLTKLDAMFAVVRGIATIIAAAAVKIGVEAAIPTGGVSALITTPVYESMAGIHVLADKYHAFISAFIWPVGWNPLQWGAILKYGCIIYSGKLCEGFDGVVGLLVFDANEAGTSAYYNLNNQTKVPENDIRIFHDWDPYRSIHTAKSCLYVDAYIYNLRKERQINCMYTTCLDQNAKNGLSGDVCEAQYQERQCLYVDGAVWNAINWGGAVHWFQNILNAAISSADVLAGSLFYFPVCGVWEYTSVADFGEAYLVPIVGVKTMAAATGCHAWASALSLAEHGWFTEFIDWDFQANLEGTDYCAGY